MTKLIKGGTVVTHDRTFKADVFVQHDRIVALGPDLSHDADHTIGAAGCRCSTNSVTCPSPKVADNDCSIPSAGSSNQPR